MHQFFTTKVTSGVIDRDQLSTSLELLHEIEMELTESRIAYQRAKEQVAPSID